MPNFGGLLKDRAKTFDDLSRFRHLRPRAQRAQCHFELVVTQMMAARRKDFIAHPRSEQGFTILELMVALGIVALLSALAIPQMASFNGQLHASSDARMLATKFATWRAEAARLREPVVVSFNAPTSSAPADFSADFDGDGVADADARIQ